MEFAGAASEAALRLRLHRFSCQLSADQLDAARANRAQIANALQALPPKSPLSARVKLLDFRLAYLSGLLPDPEAARRATDKELQALGPSATAARRGLAALVLAPVD